jgi:hypothetical protein
MKPILRAIVCAASVLCQSPAPFACNMRVFQPEERKHHIQLTHSLMSAVVALHDLPQGYAFQVDPERISLLELAEWTTRERKCCPFFDFQLALDGAGQLTLSITGREGVKQFVREEFHDLVTAARW